MSKQTTSCYQSLEAGCQIAMAAAEKRGAKEIQVTLAYDDELRITMENNEFTLANTLQSQGIHLGVHHQQRKGTAATNMTGEKSILDIVGAAMDIAKFTLPDPCLNYLSPEIATKAKPLDFLHNENISQLRPEELKEAMIVVNNILAQDSRLCLERFDLSTNTSVHGLFNSHGVIQGETQSTVNWEFVAMAKDKGQDVSGMDYQGGFCYNADEFLEAMKTDAELFMAKVLGNLNPTKCSGYKGLVLFTPRAMEELFLDFALFQCSGRQVMDEHSQWQNKAGNKVLSQLITIEDRPHEKLLWGATAYDSDGVPTKMQKIIDQGQLCLFTHDAYSAKKTKQAVNGLAGGPFSIHMHPGESSLASLYDSQSELLVVDRFSGNTDLITGDFSGVVKNSHFYRHGKKQAAVHETMIAGNFFQLGQNIKGISQEIENVEGRYLAPYCLFSGVDVSG